MKYFLLILAMALVGNSAASAQKADKAQIKSTIQQWIAAGDQQSAEAAAPLMDATFHVYLNQMFGSDKVTTIDKEGYLSMLREKKLGGKARTLKFKRITIAGNIATVQLEMKSSVLLFNGFIQLAKDKTGNWRIVSDLPSIEKL